MWGTIKASLTFLILLSIVAPATVMASGITPAVDDVSAEKGEPSQTVLSILNNETENITYVLDVIGIELGEAEADLSFFDLDEETQSWFVLSNDEFTLAPEQTMDVTATITPSLDAEDGVYVFGIRTMERPHGVPGVQIGSGFITLVFVTIGDVQGGFEVLDFSSSEDVVSELPVTFFLTIRNDEERIVQPNGAVLIKNMLGDTVVTLDINPDMRRVPKGQTRTFSASWSAEDQSLLTAGFYTAELRAVPWFQGEEITEELTVTIVPWRTIALASLLLIVFFFIYKYTNVFKKQI